MNIYDIAEKSGVSIATISRVLNGGKNVSKKTYDKVMNVIKEEGYTPNVFARGLGLNTMKTIGILVTDVADTHYAKMISILTEYLHKLELDVLLSSTGRELKEKKRKLKMLLEKRVDAIFLIGSAQQELEDNSHLIKAAAQVPVILLNGYIDASGIISITSNEFEATKNCVKLLYESGVRHPLYLYDYITYSGLQKLNGLKAGLTQAGIPETDALLVQISKTLPEIQQTVCELLESKQTFDAVIASEDIIAIGALKALNQYKKKIPIIGYNNSILAEVSSPSLTSIDNMLEPVCRTGVQLFQDVLEGKTTSTHVIIACKLIERETFQSSKHYYNL